MLITRCVPGFELGRFARASLSIIGITVSTCAASSGNPEPVMVGGATQTSGSENPSFVPSATFEASRTLERGASALLIGRLVTDRPGAFLVPVGAILFEPSGARPRLLRIEAAGIPSRNGCLVAPTTMIVSASDSVRIGPLAIVRIGPDTFLRLNSPAEEVCLAVPRN